MKNYIEQLENKHTMLIQKSILENDDHCKPFGIKDKILLGVSAMFWVWLLVEMLNA